MDYINVVLPYLATHIIISGSQSVNNCDAQQELIEQFLTVRNIDTAILYTCWSMTGNVQPLCSYYIILL